jgi:hypothetical protein
MTTIHVFDPATTGHAAPELPPAAIGVLAVGAAELLQQAASLPQPHYVGISDDQTITLQFPSEPESIRAVVRWGTRFGGVMLSEPIQIEGATWTWCHAEFSYYGIPVSASTHLPDTPATPTIPAPRSGDPQ